MQLTSSGPRRRIAGPDLLVVAGLVGAIVMGLAVGLDWRLAPLVLIAAALAIAPKWSVLLAGIIAAQALPGRYVQGRLLVSDVLLMAYVARSLIDVGRRGLHGPLPMRVLWPLLAFVALSWATTIANSAAPAVTPLARVTLYTVVFIAASLDPKGARPLIIGVVLFGAIEAGAGALHLTPYIDGRLSGLYGDPQQTGILLLATLSGASLLPQPYNLLVTCLSGWGIFLTKTRGTWIAAVVALGVRFGPWRKHRSLAVGLTIGAVAIVGWWLVPSATQHFALNPGSISLRQVSWRDGLALFAQRPWLGYGWAIGGKLTLGPPPYNLFINVAASGGIFTVAALIWFLGALMLNTARSESEECRALLPFLAAFITQSFGEMTIFAASPASILFFALAGAAVAAQYIRAAGDGASDPSLVNRELSITS